MRAASGGAAPCSLISQPHHQALGELSCTYSGPPLTALQHSALASCNQASPPELTHGSRGDREAQAEGQTEESLQTQKTQKTVPLAMEGTRSMPPSPSLPPQLPLQEGLKNPGVIA